MRVLVVAASDPGGCHAYLGQELRRRGLEWPRLITLEPSPCAGFPRDIADVHDGGQEVRHLLRTAEVIHVVDLLPEDVTLFGVPLAERLRAPNAPRVVLQRDAPLRPVAARRLESCARDQGWPLVVTRPELRSLAGARFLPPFIPFWRGLWTPLLPGTRRRSGAVRPRVVFASSLTSLAHAPAMESLLDAVTERLVQHPNVRLETLSGRLHRLVLRRRRQADLTLTTQFSRSALESLAVGVPVVSPLGEEARSAYAEMTDGDPPPVVDLSDLEERLEQRAVIEDPDPVLFLWARKALDPRRWLDLCQRLYSPMTARSVA